MSDPRLLPGRRSPLALGVLATVLAACSAAQSSDAPSEEPEPSAAASSPAASTAPQSAVVPLEPGGLDAGTRYALGDLGISLQPDVEGWFAVMPNGGDLGFSREGVTVYVYLPDTILAPDGTQIPVPSDPQALIDAAHATTIADVVATEEFAVGGINALSAELEASGGSESAPLLTTGSGSLGLPDGRSQWIVFELEGRPVIFSLERASSPDVDAAWEVAGPLIDSLQLTP